MSFYLRFRDALRRDRSTGLRAHFRQPHQRIFRGGTANDGPAQDDAERGDENKSESIGGIKRISEGLSLCLSERFSLLLCPLFD